jgi:hypothetical protein
LNKDLSNFPKNISDNQMINQNGNQKVDHYPQMMPRFSSQLNSTAHAEDRVF